MLGHPTRRRRTAVALALASSLTIVLAAAPATAEQRTITVTLLGGKVISVTVDVPPGTPLDAITLPAALAPVVSVKTEAHPPAAASVQPAPGKKPAKKVEHHKAKRKPAATVVKSKRASSRHAKAKSSVAGGPSATDPTFAYALPGPAPIGVPNFFIDSFRIPPFLLPIYQAAGTQYGVRWEVLAAINEIETDYGRNLSTSTAGAIGWMQFMPSTWKYYGVDANGDGVKDPYNPVDAIFAAARYLNAAGAAQDIRKAVFAYNHAGWYVDSVLMRARLIAGLPPDLVGSLTGLTEGRFPVAAASKYVRGSTSALNIYARSGAPVIAVADAIVTKLGTRRNIGHFVQIRDVYGNTYTYGQLKAVAKTYPLPAAHATSAAIDLPANDSWPGMAASAGRQAAIKSLAATLTRAAAPSSLQSGAAALPKKQRLFAHPQASVSPAGAIYRGTRKTRRAPLRVGSRIAGGTVLGRIGAVSPSAAPHLRFQIRPAGKAAPLIDPKPILDGWKLLESTAIYRAAGRNPLLGADPSVGQVLLMSKEALQQRVLADSRISIYPGGRDDIRSGQIDRRVLATLEFLSASGLKPTVSSLRGNHSRLTTGGNVSEHSTGDAVDISAINAIPILGHQGPGSITDITIRRLLTLQGTIKPHQIISLMTYQGADNTLSLPDHANHIHVGFRVGGSDIDNSKLGSQLAMILKPGQWTRLISRLGKVANPTIPALHPKEGR